MTLGILNTMVQQTNFSNPFCGNASEIAEMGHYIHRPRYDLTFTMLRATLIAKTKKNPTLFNVGLF